MGDVLLAEEESLLLQVLHHHIIALGVVLAVIPLIGHNALGVHGHLHPDVGEALLVVLLADEEVVGAETGGGVDAARAGVQGHMVPVEDHAVPVKEGVLCRHELKAAALKGGKDLAGGVVQPGLLADPFTEVLGHDIHLSVGGLEEHVVKAGVEADGQVARDGPGGGGPDDEIHLGKVPVLPQLALVVPNGELHKDGGTGVVLVLDLSLGQGGLVVGAPIDRLQALVDKALFGHLAEDLDLLGLKLGEQGNVGVLPLAQHPQPLELAGHFCHIALGVLPAFAAELGGGHLLPFHALILQDRRLNGQAMGIPAGDVGGAEARHVLGLHDKILQDLVEGGTDVDVAVGVGRAVVEDKAGLALVALYHLVIKVFLLHGFEHVGLPLGQGRPHGELGLGQVYGGVVVHSNVSFMRNLFLFQLSLSKMILLSKRGP